MNTEPRSDRSVRSFIKRSGRMTRGQERALEELLPTYTLDTNGQPLTSEIIQQVFGRSAPTILDIGFGDGEALFETALSYPENNFIGVEVHEPGIGHLLIQLQKHGVRNVRVVCIDAVEFLESAVCDGVLQKICLFFPDPWPKKKHHKRRILQRPFIELASRKLEPRGLLHFATDWEDYALQALEYLEKCDLLENVSGCGHFSPRPGDRPITKFERRGMRLGHGVWDIVMRRNG